ncbi:hypothetical protein V1L52_07215 [Treponema sp. HNW]|uniref:hypothetical protein n=1 Tax=Treponema sp. HNW TaxID=3116654 RepID=UPI003D0A31F1
MAEALLLIFLTVINLVLWAVFFIRFKKSFSPDILLSNIKNEVDKLLIEINRTVDEDITLMESRRESLRELLQIADKRLSLLQKEENSRLREEKVLNKLAPQSKFSSRKKTRQEQLDTGYTPPVADEGIQLAIDFEAYRSRDTGSEPEIRFQGRNPQDSGPEILNEAPGEAEKEIPLRDRALSLYAQGLSADLISQRLKLPVSAVQFIIDTFGE